jgi:hypothetical protein
MRSEKRHPLPGAVGLMFMPKAWGHGGLSALEGMLELLLMMYSLGTLLISWLVFVGIFVWKNHLNQVMFHRFRVIMYLQLGLLVLLMVRWMIAYAFSMELLGVCCLVVASEVIITEATIWATRKLRVDLRS